MKKGLLVVCLGIALLTMWQCEWYNTTILGKPSQKELAEQAEREKARQDSMKQAEAQRLAEQQNNQATTTAKSNSNESKKYQVVVGCFQISSNADNMYAELQKRGLQPVAFRLGSFTCISAEAHDRQQDAFDAMYRIAGTDIYPDDVWVYVNQ